MKPADVKSSTCIDDAFENNNKHPKCEVYYGTKLTSQYRSSYDNFARIWLCLGKPIHSKQI